MTLLGPSTRREMLMKLGIAFNTIVAAILAVPIVKYIMSPVIGGEKSGYDSWLSLGDVTQFPAGETRLAVYRNPVVNPWDGDTADLPCWVRKK